MSPSTKNLREIPAEEEQPLTKEEKAFFDFLLKEGWLEKDQEFLDGHAITDEYIIVNTPSLDEVPDCVRALKELCESYAKYALSSELSLAIKGLREAMTDKKFAVVGAMNRAEQSVQDNALILTKVQLLNAFDSKAKEILGESS